MTRVVRIEDDEDFKFLQRYVQDWAVRCKANIAAYVEYADMFDRLADAFGNATKVKGTEELLIPKADKAERKEELAGARLLAPCKEHPTYGAKRSPRKDCKGCWDAYEKYNGTAQAQVARRRFQRANAEGD